MNNRRTAHLIGLVLALAVTACTGGAGADEQRTPTTAPQPQATDVAGVRHLEITGCDDPAAEVEMVCDAFDLVQSHYVDPLSDTVLADAAARGLSDLEPATSQDDLVCAAPTGEFGDACRVALDHADTSAEAAEAMVTGIAKYALDANSVYLDRAALDLLEEEQDGEIQGIGALVSAETVGSGDATQCAIVSATCHLLIVSTISGSPAEQAGLRADDVIVGVDGQDIDGWTVDEVTATVRGPAGSVVTLDVLRGEEELEIDITRAEVVIPVVESEQVGSTGYVRINLFTDTADEQFEEALGQLLQDDVESLVVDLRDNPGGMLDTAIEVTSAFLGDGDVVVTQGAGSKTSYEVSGHPLVPSDVEVVFLVNRGSASASEVVSAVLQERGRATVVGESTFGKNTVQQRFPLADGGALKLTIARWVTPGGLDFGGVGVTPDAEKHLEPNLSVDRLVSEALAASMTASTARQG